MTGAASRPARRLSMSPPRVRSMSDQVTESLRSMILVGDLRSGDQVTQEKLAEDLGVSTMPVREALLRLAHEGFVQGGRGRSFRIAPTTREDIQDIYWVHATLAGELTARACERISAEDLDQLTQVHQRWLAAVSAGNVSALERENFEFHRLLNKAAQSPKLLMLLRNTLRLIPEHFYSLLKDWASDVDPRPRADPAGPAQAGRGGGPQGEQHPRAAGRQDAHRVLQRAGILGQPERQPLSALDGVRVLELTHFLAGPYAGLVLADLGADVIKLEDPRHPDEVRTLAPLDADGVSLYFKSLNWGKRSVGVRLSDPRAEPVLRDLVASADVVVDNFRPRVLAKLKLSHEFLVELNPRIITVFADRFRRDRAVRPMARLRLHDPGPGRRDGAGRRAGRPADQGRHLLRRPRRRSGPRARRLRRAARAVAHRGRPPHRPRPDRRADLDAHLPGGLEPQRRHRTDPARQLGPPVAGAGAELRDRRRLRVAVRRATTACGRGWSRCSTTTGCESRGSSPRAAGWPIGATCSPGWGDLLRMDTSAAWTRRLSSAGVACAAVNDLTSALSDPHVTARGLVADDGGFRHVRGPVLSLSAPGPRPAPTLGADNAGVLGELGYAPDSVAGLENDGVLGRG